jgi:glycosyltransferase involved in cell wall biosynthesis
VRILILVTRYPRPHGKGDALRAHSWITELALRHEVRVVTPAARPPDDLRRSTGADVISIPTSPARRAGSALGAAIRGAPLQVGWMMPRAAWRAALLAMDDADVVLAMTTRSLRGPATRPLVIDHIDALSLNMRRRAQGDERLFVRAFAQLESRRFGAWERRCARWSQGAIATAEEDAAALPSVPPVEIVPSALDHVDPAWAVSQDRPIDLILSGNMRYPPNRRAALMVDREITPLLRARMPGARVAVVGRDAATLGLRNVEVMSDVPDMLAVLRTAKVAIAPLELGTGSPNKVLEAAASGAAVVSSPWAAARFGIAARTADGAQGYCDAVCDLLSDPEQRAALVAESQDAVRRHSTHELARRVELLLQVVAADG